MCHLFLFEKSPLNNRHFCLHYYYLVHLALTEAAERFKELQTEKEMRQLQEDRKNDKKPPPYRHIRVQVLKFLFCVFFWPLLFLLIQHLTRSFSTR